MVSAPTGCKVIEQGQRGDWFYVVAEGTLDVVLQRPGHAELARGVGKAVVNSPLFKAAVAGNDPNVGRLVSTVGSYLGSAAPEI